MSEKLSPIAGARWGWALLTLAIVVVIMPVGGPLLAYVAIFAVVLSLLLFDGPALAAASRDRGVQLFILAFLLMAAAFILSAQAPVDYWTIGDFAAFPLVLPAYALFRRHEPAAPWIFVALCFLATLSLLAHGIYEVEFLHQERAGGNSSPIYFSNFGVLLGFLSLAGFFIPGFRFRWLFALGLFAGFGAALLGGSRGAAVIAAVEAPIFLVFALSQSKRPILAAVIMLGVFVAAIVGAALLFDASRVAGLYQQAIELLTTGKSSDQSTYQRLEFYRAGWLAFLDSPLYGNGWLRRFTAAAPYFQIDIGIPHPRVAHLHNDIINIASGAGLLGVAAYVAALSAPLVSTLRLARDELTRFRLYVATALVGGYVAMGLTDSMFVYETPKTLFCLLAAIAMALFIRRPATA
jgi:O-antigen ligase